MIFCRLHLILYYILDYILCYILYYINSAQRNTLTSIPEAHAPCQIAETPLYEEEDTCMSYEEDKCMSYEEEDTCMSYEEEDTCHCELMPGALYVSAVEGSVIRV